jgi:hypothetical protein
MSHSPVCKKKKERLRDFISNVPNEFFPLLLKSWKKARHSCKRLNEMVSQLSSSSSS